MDLKPFANRRPFEFKKFAIRVQNSRIYLKMPSSSQFLNDSFAFFANFKRFKQFLKGFQAVLNRVLNSIFAIFSAFPVLFESISLDSTNVQSEIFEHKIRHFETKSSYFEHFLSLFKRFNLCFIVFSQNNSSCIEASSSDCESPSFIGIY